MRVKKGFAVLTLILFLFALTSCGKEDILALFEMKSVKIISGPNTDQQEKQGFYVQEEHNISLEETSLPDQSTNVYKQSENDGHTKETAIELSEGYSFQYEIAQLNEEVWLKFVPTQRNKATYLIIVENIDFKSTLSVKVTEDNRQLEFFTLWNEDTSSVEIMPDSSSSYYISIKDGKSDSRTVGKFNVSIVRIEHTAGLSESDAPSVQTGYMYTLTKNSKYDDYFVLNITESGELHFSLTNENIYGNIGLNVVDQNGKSVLYTYAGTGNTSKDSVNVYTGEKFYIIVHSASGPCDGNYSFSIHYN